jgi:hypothetical protein
MEVPEQSDITVGELLDLYQAKKKERVTDPDDKYGAGSYGGINAVQK